MAYEFVDPPHGLSYAAPAVDFGILGNLPDTYRKAQEQKRQADVANAFKDQPLPLDPVTGLPDYGKIMQVLASKGGIDAITKLAPAATEQALIGQAGQISPYLQQGGGAAPPPGPSLAPPQGAPAAPQSMPAPPASATGGYTPMANAPGSVVDIVSSKMPQDSQKTGAVIANIARAAGVDPNAALTPEQSARVTRLADAYAARTGARPAPAGPAAAPGGGAPGTATPDQMADARRRLAAQMAPAGDRVTAGFDAAGAPTARAQASPADVAPPNAAPMQGSPAAPQGPIVPQVPLPKGFTDPQQAIMALRTEAARLSTNPYAKGQVSALNDWATRIENSIQPLKIGNEIVDPQGRVLYRGQGAANPANIALQRFLQENPTASAAEIQNFVQSGRRSGSAAAQLVNRYLQEHPEATAEDIAAFTRKQQVETTREKVVGAADARALSNSLNKQIMAKNALESFENTAIKNGEILVQLADKVDTTGIPVIERWIRAGRRAVAGDTDVSNFNLQMDLFRTEAAKIITNPNLSGQLTDSARHEMAEAIPSASSAKQIREGFNLLKGDFKRRGEATNKQIELIRKQLRGEAPVESSVEEGGGSVTAAPATGGGGVEVRWEKGPDGKYRKAQ